MDPIDGGRLRGRDDVMESTAATVDTAPGGVVCDRFNRPLSALRLSVTDRCNLRCRYCLPDDECDWMTEREILTFEELTTLAKAFIRVGVNRIRLTGGEPLLRRDLSRLVRMLRQAHPACELCLTTNGVLLDRQAHALARAGLDRVTISLDSLHRDTFSRMACRDLLARALAGIDAARRAGFRRIRLNCVVLRGLNDSELPDLVRHGREIGAEVRFIEYMELPGSRHWSPQSFVSKREMLEIIETGLGPVALCPEGASRAPRGGTAERYRCGDGTTFGIIAPMTAPFCETCTRARVTADGRFYLCLHAERGFDLRPYVREGRSGDELAALLARIWRDRTDRGSHERSLSTCARAPSVDAAPVRMNARGG